MAESRSRKGRNGPKALGNDRNMRAWRDYVSILVVRIFNNHRKTDEESWSNQQSPLDWRKRYWVLVKGLGLSIR